MVNVTYMLHNVAYFSKKSRSLWQR